MPEYISCIVLLHVNLFSLNSFVLANLDNGHVFEKWIIDFYYRKGLILKSFILNNLREFCTNVLQFIQVEVRIILH